LRVRQQQRNKRYELCSLLTASMKKVPGDMPELGDFVENTKSQQVSGAVLGQPKTRRDLECGSVGKGPSDSRRNVVGCPMWTEMFMRSKATVHFHPDLKILRTKVAALGSRCEGEWAADPNGITEFKRAVLDVLFCDEVFGNRPTFEIAAEY